MGSKTDYYLPQTYFISLGGMSQKDFEYYVGTLDPILRATADGYPVFGFVQFLHKRSKESLFQNKDIADRLKIAEAQMEALRVKNEKLQTKLNEAEQEIKDIKAKSEAKVEKLEAEIEELPDPMQELKRRKEEQLIMQYTLKNISMMKMFVLKDTASNRMIGTLQAVAGEIKRSISNASLELGGDVRRVQEILTKHYNESMDILKHNSEFIEWDDEDDSNRIREKLKELSQDDKVLTSLIESTYGNL